MIPTDTPRDCNHPSFPLHRRERMLRGKVYAEWTRKICKKRVSFGACSNDPTGAIAWQLYDAEHAAWKAKQNPRAGFRRLAFVRAIDPAWLLAGPLAKIGIGIADAGTGRLVCLNCRATWKVKFKDVTTIPKCRLKCPRDCASLPPDEVLEMIQLAQGSDWITREYERLMRQNRDGWKSAPQNIDADAAAEGWALVEIAKLAPRRQPRKLRPTLSRVDKGRQFESV